MIDNCTKCGECSHESVCCKKFNYEELIKFVKENLSAKYKCDSESYLAAQKLSITLSCCDYIPKVKMRTPGVRELLKENTAAVISFSLTKEDSAKLVAESIKSRKTKSEIIREALEMYYKSQNLDV